MNANTSTEKSDLEYHFSEDQLTEGTGQEAILDQEQLVTKPSSRFSRKKIITGVVVLAMMGGIFQFLNTRDKSAEDSSQAEIEKTAQTIKNEKPAVVKQAEKTVAPKIVAPAPAVPKQALAVKPVTAVVDSTSLEQQLEKVSVSAAAPAVSAEYESEIKELKSGMTGVTQSVTDLQKTLESLTTSLQSLSNQVEQLNKEQKAKPAVAPQSEAKPEVKIEYYLKAVIVGRAWLESETGELTTVKVGDELKGYGKITDINPEEGEVTTSSGGIIKHAANDS